MPDAAAPIPEDEVLTVDEVAALLKIEPNTVRSLCRKGELPGIKLGKHWRFLHSEVLATLRPPPELSAAERALRAGPATISQQDAAEILGVTTRTVRRMLADGRLETIPSSTGVARISRASVLAVYGGGPDSDAG